MITNKDLLKAYQEASTTASNVSRQLGFAGIAIVWMFRVEPPWQSPRIDSEFVWPAGLIVASLALDLLHYVVKAAIFGIYHRCKERAKTDDDDEFTISRYTNWPALGLFWGKLGLMTLAYVWLVVILYRRLV